MLRGTDLSAFTRMWEMLVLTAWKTLWIWWLRPGEGGLQVGTTHKCRCAAVDLLRRISSLK